MKETILLFNPPEKDRLLKLEMALFPLHVRLKKVAPSEYNQPLGVLAGIKDMTPAEGIYDGPELPDTMLVFCFLDALLSLDLEGRIVGILHILNDSLSDVVKSDETRVLFGQDSFYEKMLNLEFKITPFSFFQPNTRGA